MARRQEKLEVSLLLITTVPLPCTSLPRAGNSLHLFFTSCHHFGTRVPCSRMSCYLHMAHSSWHRAGIYWHSVPRARSHTLPGQDTTHHGSDFCRQHGQRELRHCAHLHHTGLVCQRAPASCLFQLESNFQLNNSAEEAGETLS